MHAGHGPDAPGQQRVFMCSRQHTLGQLLLLLAAEDPAAAKAVRQDIGRAMQVHACAADCMSKHSLLFSKHSLVGIPCCLYALPALPAASDDCIARWYAACGCGHPPGCAGTATARLSGGSNLFAGQWKDS